MSKPENHYLITKIKASITAGIRPCSIVFHEQPTKPWTELDFKLLEAYQQLQDEICPQCGQPVWLCRSNAQNIEWSVEETTCWASRAVEEKKWKHDHKKGSPKKEDKAEWGRVLYPVPRVPNYLGETAVLPTREEFYRNV